MDFVVPRFITLFSFFQCSAQWLSLVAQPSVAQPSAMLFSFFLYFPNHIPIITYPIASSTILTTTRWHKMSAPNLCSRCRKMLRQNEWEIGVDKDLGKSKIGVGQWSRMKQQKKRKISNKWI